MHLAMPPRKTSRPPPYAARSQSSFGLPSALRNLVRSKPRALVAALLGFFALLWLLGAGRHTSSTPGVNIPKVPVGSGPPVVIVTTIDPRADAAWVDKIKANRQAYAKKHGAYPPYTPHSMPAYTNTPLPQATSPSSPAQPPTPSTTPRRPGRASPPSATP
jgi:mannan polymerase II complex MNN11 subunit